MNQNKVITLKAGEKIEFPYLGYYFKCLSAQGRFQVRFDNEDWRSVRAGRAFLKRKEFSRIELISPTLNEIEIFVGDEEVRDDPQVVSIEENTINAVSKVAQTDTVAGPVVLLVNEELVLPGVLNADGLTYRKSITVQNLSEVLNLQVTQPDGSVLHTVPPGESRIWETSADLKIVQPENEEIPLNVCEIFYKS